MKRMGFIVWPVSALLAAFVFCVQPNGTAGQPISNPGNQEPAITDWDETYRSLLESGDFVTGAELWGVGEVRGYQFTDEFGVNELLLAIASLPIPSEDTVEVFITPDAKITQHRLRREIDVDWRITAKARISLAEAGAEFVGWQILIAIDESCVDLDAIQIPYGLDVVYTSELTRLLDYHAQRNADIKLKIKEDVPPTSTDLRRELTGGRFE